MNKTFIQVIQFIDKAFQDAGTTVASRFDFFDFRRFFISFRVSGIGLFLVSISVSATIAARAERMLKIAYGSQTSSMIITYGASNWPYLGLNKKLVIF